LSFEDDKAAGNVTNPAASHVRLTIQASNSRAKREVCSVSALPARLKSQEYLAFK
jgi:hypothetical protein